MEKLFAFRVVFHQVAASEIPQTHTSVVVCWVDVILAKLSQAILVVMDKFCDTKVVSLGTLSQHRDEMTLRAVLQFPRMSSFSTTSETLLTIMNVKTSGRMFPYSFRLRMSPLQLYAQRYTCCLVLMYWVLDWEQMTLGQHSALQQSCVSLSLYDMLTVSI